MDRERALDQSSGWPLRLVGGINDGAGCGVAASSDSARVLRASRRLQHLRRCGLRGPIDRDGAIMLWVAGNIAGLSASHREAVARQRGLKATELAAFADSARARYAALDAARQANPPFIDSAEWMHLPLTGYPDFSAWQPYLDEILRHPAPDEFRARHNFRATIDIPGFHVTTWFDIFQTSVLAAAS